MKTTCPNCGELITLGGLGRKRLNIPLKNICEALRSCKSVAAAAAELNCSQGYIFNALKAAGLTTKEILDIPRG